MRVLQRVAVPDEQVKQQLFLFPESHPGREEGKALAEFQRLAGADFADELGDGAYDIHAFRADAQPDINGLT